MRLMILFFLLLLLLVACADEKTTTISGSNHLTDSNIAVVDSTFNEQYMEANSLALYLPEDQSRMVFKSAENTLTIDTQWTSPHRATITTSILDQQKTYHFEIKNYELYVTTDAQEMLYASLPIEQSTGIWQHMKTLQTLQTPYDTFTDVHVFEYTSNGEIIRHYVAPQFGVVQYEIEIDGKTETFSLQQIEYL